MGVLFMFTSSCKKDDSNNSIVTGTVTDLEGNVYKTVKIGDQWWMAENLRVTKYRNGDSLPNIISNETWAILTSGACCNVLNDTIISKVYGKLYNWYSISDSRNITPIGWHIPDDNEWLKLASFLGGIFVAGGKLKEVGTTNWKDPNFAATNESGFLALPAGMRLWTGDWNNRGEAAEFWSSTEKDDYSAFATHLSSGDNDLYIHPGNKLCGFSIRCIKDN